MKYLTGKACRKITALVAPRVCCQFFDSCDSWLIVFHNIYSSLLEETGRRYFGILETDLEPYF